MNYLRRLISNLAGKTKAFSDLIKLERVEEFKWEKQHQIAFDWIKGYLSKPLVLISLKDRSLKLYLSTAKESIRCLLAQNNAEGHEHVVYYLSRVLNSTKTRYTPIEKLCLALSFICTKLRHYLIKSQVYVVSQTDLMKYMLSRPIIIRRIGKWFFSLLEFTLVYFPQKSIKGQALANFLADHPSLEIQPENDVELGIYEVERQPWIRKFDGPSMEKSARARIIIISQNGIKTTLSFNLTFKCTNNQAKYEALVIDLEILMELGAQEVHIIGDSQLVLR